MTRIGLASVFFLSATCIPTVAQAVTSAEVYTAAPYGYGRFEARLQFAVGDGVVSSFFLWKDGSEVAGTFWNELDFEKLGADCHVELNAIYGNPQANHIQRLPPADACTAYHTYAYEWTPDAVVWLIDGVEVRRDTGETAQAFAQNAAGGMQLRFNAWPGDATFGGNFSPDILPVHQYIDWVQFSSYNAGTFTLAWREDFDSNTLPTGWGTATWGSPKNLSTHDPRNVNFIDGYLVISLTADNATGPAGAMPQVPGSAGSGGAGGSDGIGGTGATGGTGGLEAGSAGMTQTAGSGGSMVGSGGSPTTGGSAGMPGSAGNAPGTGGSMVAPGSGGAPGSAGTSASAGVPGAAASGGSVPAMGQGGATGVAGMNATAGTGPSAAPASPDDGGCSFSAAGSHSSRAVLAVLGLCAMLFGKRARSRKRAARA
jgi:hypothetical protein